MLSRIAYSSRARTLGQAFHSAPEERNAVTPMAYNISKG